MPSPDPTGCASGWLNRVVAALPASEALNGNDAVTGPAITRGLRDRGFRSAVQAGDEPPKNRNAFPALALAAAEMLRAADGPRIAALEIGGWDTRSAQLRRLEAPLKQLDAGLLALRTGLGPPWDQTALR